MGFGFSRILYEKVPITLRLDPYIHEALKYVCKQEIRSLNTQIEYILKKYLYSYDDIGPNDRLGDLIQEIASRDNAPISTDSEQ